jgi:hypothetical protein
MLLLTIESVVGSSYSIELKAEENGNNIFYMMFIYFTYNHFSIMTRFSYNNSSSDTLCAEVLAAVNDLSEVKKNNKQDNI